MTINEKITEFLLKNKLGDALDLALSSIKNTDKDIHKTLILLKSQFFANETENNKGLLEGSDYKRTKAIIQNNFQATLENFPKNILEKYFASSENSEEINKMDKLTKQELEGYQSLLEKIINKKQFLESELLDAYDSDKRYAIKNQINQLEQQLIDLKQKISGELSKVSNSTNDNNSNKNIILHQNKLLNNNNQTSMNSENSNYSPKIYFSYAWGDAREEGESREKIVDDLYNELVKENFNLVRDKMDLGYRGFISDFMKQIGQGDLIVVATSDKYFRSPYCMYELYEIARNCKFDKNIFAQKSLPIMVEFIDFSKPKILKEYITYWKTQKEEWEELGMENLAGVNLDRYSKTKLIQQNFGQLTDWLIDMNTLNPKMLSDNNFAEIKKVIVKNSNVVAKEVEIVEKINNQNSIKENKMTDFNKIKIEKAQKRWEIVNNEIERLNESIDLLNTITQGKEIKQLQFQLENEKVKLNEIEKEISNLQK